MYKRQVYGFGAGTKKLYDYLNRNPECMSAPVSYTNDIRTISALDNFMSINNAVDLDLFGQVNACLLYTSVRFSLPYDFPPHYTIAGGRKKPVSSDNMMYHNHITK